MSSFDVNLLFRNANSGIEKSLNLNVEKTKFMLISEKDIMFNALGLKLKIAEEIID